MQTNPLEQLEHHCLGKSTKHCNRSLCMLLTSVQLWVRGARELGLLAAWWSCLGLVPKQLSAVFWKRKILTQGWTWFSCPETKLIQSLVTRTLSLGQQDASHRHGPNSGLLAVMMTWEFNLVPVWIPAFLKANQTIDLVKNWFPPCGEQAKPLQGTTAHWGNLFDWELWLVECQNKFSADMRFTPSSIFCCDGQAKAQTWFLVALQTRRTLLMSKKTKNKFWNLVPNFFSGVKKKRSARCGLELRFSQKTAELAKRIGNRAQSRWAQKITRGNRFRLSYFIVRFKKLNFLACSRAPRFLLQPEYFCYIACLLWEIFSCPDNPRKFLLDRNSNVVKRNTKYCNKKYLLREQRRRWSYNAVICEGTKI